MTDEVIFFRVDSSVEMGTGHFMRCLTLADFIKEILGFRPVFICAQHLGIQKQLLDQRGYELIVLPVFDGNNHSKWNYAHAKWLPHSEEYDAKSTSAAAERVLEEGGRCRLVVVDHYALGEHWEVAMGRVSDVMAIDDLADRSHAARWVLDQTFSREAQDYLPLVSKRTTLLLGVGFALVKAGFSKLRQIAETKRPALKSVENILVTLGGSDPDNVTSLVLNALMNLDHNAEVTIVAGAGNPHIRKLEELVKSYAGRCRFNLLKATSEMPKLMLEADLCIGASGSTSWERCVLGLPCLSLNLADNQSLIARALSEVEAIHDFGRLTDDTLPAFTAVLADMLFDPGYLRRMSLNAFKVCDGQGLNRVLKEVFIK